MTTIIEQIRAEIERRKKALHSTLFNDEYNDLLSFLDTLEEQTLTDCNELQEPEVDLDSKVTFDCISKRVTMTVQELINYYIDRECCDVAEECGF
ncbi:MAG: hypothetical protein J6U51_00860 [Bacteroidales bacterium]|nr:hypothetical protein [Bacteroidales bacterium]